MQSSFTRVFLFMLAGPILWAVHFLFVYAVNGVACARPPLHGGWLDVPLSSWIIIAASLLTLAAMALAYLCLRTRTPRLGDAQFVPWLAGALSLLSALAVVWETLPVLLAPGCA